MKRKTKNASLLYVINRQEKEISKLHDRINQLEHYEKQRDLAWSTHSDQRVREINSLIRQTKK